MIDYDYSAGNRLETPHNYMYTPYGGKDFLKSYRESRDLISQNLIRKHSIEDLFVSRLDSFQRHPLEDYFYFISMQKLLPDSGKVGPDITEYIKEGNVETVLLASEIACVILEDSDISDEIIVILSVFTKKYEVFKKIFGNYNADLKKTTQEYQELRIYVLFNFSFLAAFHRTKNLKFLNVGLKMCDMLCSMSESISKPIEAKLMLIILKLEEMAIEQITTRKNLTF